MNSPITTGIPPADLAMLEAHLRLTQAALAGVDGDCARWLDVAAATLPQEYTRDDLARAWCVALVRIVELSTYIDARRPSPWPVRTTFAGPTSDSGSTHG